MDPSFRVSTTKHQNCPEEIHGINEGKLSLAVRRRIPMAVILRRQLT